MPITPPLSTTAGIDAAIAQDPKIAQDTNVAQAYLNAGNPLVNGTIPQKPSTPTTLSSTNIDQKVQDNAAKLQVTNGSGVQYDAHGVPRYANGEVATAYQIQDKGPQEVATNAVGQKGTYETNPTTGINEFVLSGDQPSWTKAPGTPDISNPNSPNYDPAQDPTVIAENQKYEDLKAQSDALTASAISSIQQTYNALIQQQTEMNRSMQAQREQSLMLGNSGRYATASSLGVMSQQISYGTSLIADLQAKENSAIQSAKQAQFNNDQQLVDKQITLMEKVRKEKQDAIQKQQDTIAEFKKQADKDKIQADKDSAISQVMATGVTDPAQILATLQKQGNKTITAKDITDSIANMNPIQKEVADTLKLMAENDAPPEAIQKAGQSKTLKDLYAASSGYMKAKKTDFQAAYDDYKANGGTKDALQFYQAWNQAKSSGTTAGKAQGAGTGGSSLVSIPTNTLAFANNNPLNIKVGTSTQSYIDNGLADKGSTATDGGNFLKFNSPQVGLQAAKDLLFNSDLYKNLTVDAAMKKWSNNGYGGEIASGLSGKTISSLSSSEQESLISTMAQRESGSSVVAVGKPNPNISDPNEKDPAIGGLTKNGLDVAAHNYINFGSIPPLGLGQADDVKTARLSVIARAGELSQGDASAMRALYKANTSSLQNITTKYNATNAAQNTAQDNLKLALAASNSLDRTKASLANRYLQWGQGNLTTNTGLTQLELYIYTAAREYAKVTSGSAASTQGLTDTASAQADKLINAAQSPENFQAAVSAMQKDMQNVADELKNEKTAITSEISNATPQSVVSVTEDEAKSKLQTWQQADPKNDAILKQLHDAFPDAHFTDIYQKLKDKGIIQ